MKVMNAISINTGLESDRRTLEARIKTAREVVIMNILSILNIKDTHKQHKKAKLNEKLIMDRDYGYSVFKALEFNKENHARYSLGLQIQSLDSFNR